MAEHELEQRARARFRLGRIDWLTPDECDDQQLELYDRILKSRGTGAPFRLCTPEGRLEGPFNAMLMSPGVGLELQEMGAAIRYRGALPDRSREIAILLVARVERSDFEWYAHEAVGVRVGLTHDELADLRLGAMPASLSGSEALVFRVVQELLRSGDVESATFDSAVDHLGVAQVVELVVLVGYYRLLALMLRVCRTPLPAGEQRVFE